jgi:hypothetical protein
MASHLSSPRCHPRSSRCTNVRSKIDVSTQARQHVQWAALHRLTPR